MPEVLDCECQKKYWTVCAKRNLNDLDPVNGLVLLSSIGLCVPKEVLDCVCQKDNCKRRVNEGVKPLDLFPVWIVKYLNGFFIDHEWGW